MRAPHRAQKGARAGAAGGDGGGEGGAEGGAMPVFVMPSISGPSFWSLLDGVAMPGMVKHERIPPMTAWMRLMRTFSKTRTSFL